jgi:hypothetical protein
MIHRNRIEHEVENHGIPKYRNGNLKLFGLQESITWIQMK